MNEHNVLMIQMGARRNYVYARHLQDAGLLYRLACDAAWTQSGKGLLTEILKRHAPRRCVEGVPDSSIISSILPNLLSAYKFFMHEELAFPLIDDSFFPILRSKVDLNQVKLIVNYFGNGGRYLDFAKKRGCKIATDFIITPKCLEVERAEQLRWPGWGGHETPASVVEAYAKRMEKLVALSDYYLCPSDSVIRDLATIPGFDPAKVRKTPYGVSGVLTLPRAAETGRVLFVGAADLRKGIPYLAEAARLLKRRAPGIKVVVAGAVSDSVRNRPETAELTFLGKLDRQRMAEEFARADIFCLPSLAEGSAVSVFEAMANGLPCIVTVGAGSVVEHDREGLIVEERNGAALADAIEAVYTDRALRDRLGKAAMATACNYGDVQCGKQFISVIREALGSERGRLTGPKACED